MVENLIYKKTVLELLELTSISFEKLGLTPDKIVPNPHYKNQPPAKLYNRIKIEKLIDSEEVKSLQPKPKKPVDYRVLFTKKYSDKKDAIQDVCVSMFNLNRYCKYQSCSAANRETIYNLKNRLIKYLYQNSYCSRVYMHTKYYSDKICFRCNGSGVSLEDGYLDDCSDCMGTGIYQSKNEKKYYVFDFVINEEKYCWHMPEKNIDFAIDKPEYDEEINPTIVNPLKMQKSGFKKAKELIKWFLE